VYDSTPKVPKITGVFRAPDPTAELTMLLKKLLVHCGKPLFRLSATMVH